MIFSLTESKNGLLRRGGMFFTKNWEGGHNFYLKILVRGVSFETIRTLF